MASAGRCLDAESATWLRALSDVGADRDDAVRRLHALLLRAARFEVARRQRTAGTGSGSASSTISPCRPPPTRSSRSSASCTAFAATAALRRGPTSSRSSKPPRRCAAGHGTGARSPLDDDGWAQLLDDRHAAPEAQAEAGELIGAVRDAIAEVLTPHQRAVLVAITLNDVPIDVLAERQHTTRGALYKTLHDARRKLRARLAEDGLATPLPSARSQP